MERFKVWYGKQLGEGTFNIRYLILWFMLAIFPLLVIPNHIWIRFALGVVPPEYLYLPRYVALGIVAVVALVILLKDRTQIRHPAFIPLFFFMIFAAVAGFLAPIQITAWVGSPYRFTGLTTYYFCIVLFILAQTTDKTERLLKTLVYTAAIVSCLGLLQYFGINLVPHAQYTASPAAQLRDNAPSGLFRDVHRLYPAGSDVPVSPIEKTLSPALPGPGLCRPDRQPLQGYLDRLADRPGGHRLVCVEQAGDEKASFHPAGRLCSGHLAVIARRPRTVAEPYLFAEGQVMGST